MDEDWETAADSEPVVRPVQRNINKWEGEDEDDDVKDNWEDEEEKKDEEKPELKPTVPVQPKPNRALKAKLAEQERLAEKEEEERLENMTSEEKLALKLHMQKIQEESDLKSALETFGVHDINNGLDSYNPESKEEFTEFGTALSWKISQFKESPHFPQFIEDFVRTLCVHLTAADMKKVKLTVENLHSEKLKLEKQTVKKTAGNKGKSKASICTENDEIEGYQKYGNDYGDYDDYDDFM